MAERWRDATKAACARHKVALFGWTGCKPRDSMRLLEKMHNNIGSALKEKARRIMADAVLDGVQTTRLASRCDISTPKVGTATQLSNPSGKWYLEDSVPKCWFSGSVTFRRNVRLNKQEPWTSRMMTP